MCVYISHMRSIELNKCPDYRGALSSEIQLKMIVYTCISDFILIRTLEMSILILLNSFAFLN